MSFDWQSFWQSFRFGDLSIREKDYADSVADALLSMPEHERVILLDLLDLQWIAYVEQLSILVDKGIKEEFAGRAEFAFARIQINENLRARFDINPRHLRSALLNIPSGTLLDRIAMFAKR